MSPSLIGVLVGIALGFAAAFGGFAAFAVVAVMAVAGFVVGKAVEGDLDLSPYLSGRGRSRR
jgi:outer membrane lipoprotein SlyB